MHIVTAKGRVSFDAETRAAGAHKVTTFKLGVKNYGKAENPKDQFENYVVEIWGEQGVKLVERLKKGTRVTLSGVRSLRTYKGKDGAEHTLQKLTVQPNSIDIDFVPPVEADPTAGMSDDDFPGI